MMMVAGGGSSASGSGPRPLFRNHSDASYTPMGKVATVNGRDMSGKPKGHLGKTQLSPLEEEFRGLGGGRGVATGISSSGGGAGYSGSGAVSYLEPGKLPEVNGPVGARSYLAAGDDAYGPGVGGFFSFQEDGKVYTNNGGFGGGGAGSFDGGSGGGGGVSGGEGGASGGWGGGGGSLNRGDTKVGFSVHHGLGSVTISYIGED